MYARYLRTTASNGVVYKLVDDKHCHLFGCNEGFIPWLLKRQIPPGQSEPYKWHIPVRESLNGARYNDLDFTASALVIDLKPKQNKTNISLYEVLDVWGYSNEWWTPILLHLSALFMDEDPGKIDRNKFSIPSGGKREGGIYEFMYLQGGIKDGELIGKWTAPPTSPTNAALLFPESLKYFFESIRQRTPWVFD